MFSLVATRLNNLDRLVELLITIQANLGDGLGPPVDRYQRVVAGSHAEAGHAAAFEALVRDVTGEVEVRAEAFHPGWKHKSFTPEKRFAFLSFAPRVAGVYDEDVSLDGVGRHVARLNELFVVDAG